MVKQLTVLVVTSLWSLAALAAVPATYQGVWVLDTNATLRAIDAAEASLTSAQKDRLVRGVTADMKDLVLEIGDHGMTYRAPGNSMVVSLVLDEEGNDRAIFSSKEAGTVTMRIGSDGLLNNLVSRDDDFDLFYFHRQGLTDDDAATESRNDIVAFLDSLKTCSPGAFSLSYPGLGTYDNTIVGRKEERCQVRIEHPKMALLCNYSDEMIALLTSESKYEEAQHGVIGGSTDSPESQRAAEECAPM